MNKVDNKHRKLSELAQRIRDARKEANLSQMELGEGIGVSDKSVSAYEQGRSVPPFEKLRRIAEQTQHPLSFFTDEATDDAMIAAKLLSIERELTEVKRLLKARQ